MGRELTITQMTIYLFTRFSAAMGITAGIVFQPAYALNGRNMQHTSKAQAITAVKISHGVESKPGRETAYQFKESQKVIMLNETRCRPSDSSEAGCTMILKEMQ